MTDTKSINHDKERLKQRLLYLRENYGIRGIKGGTETEDMSFEELRALKEISEDILPMTVKIGGVEARNDIRECIKLEINTILVPMIESYYAFANFHATISSLVNFSQTQFAINIETITAYSNLNQILSHEGFEDIKQVTIGRNDLAASMEEAIDSEQVTNIIQDIIQRVKRRKKLTSIGGSITAVSAQKLRELAQPDYINTRHILIDLTQVRNLTFSVCEALAYEIELYKYFIKIDPQSHHTKAPTYIKRIETTKQRMVQRQTPAVPLLFTEL